MDVLGSFLCTLALLGSQVERSPIPEHGARCTFRQGEDELVLAALQGRSQPDAPEEAPAPRHLAQRILARHARAHGLPTWGRLWSGEDWIAGGAWDSRERTVPSADCSPETVRLVSAHLLRGSGEDVLWLAPHVARALEHAGEAGEARIVLQLLLERERDEGRSKRIRRRGPSVGEQLLREELAMLAFRQHEWSRVLGELEDWLSASHCGNAAVGERMKKDHLVGRCLLELQRWEELEALVAGRIVRRWGQSSCFAELLLEAEARAARPGWTEELVARLAASGADLGGFDLAQARRHREILGLPAETTLERVDELLGGWTLHETEVRALIERHEEPALQRWLGLALRPPNALEPAESALVGILISTGHSRVGPALEEALARVPLQGPGAQGISASLEQWAWSHARRLELDLP